MSCALVNLQTNEGWPSSGKPAESAVEVRLRLSVQGVLGIVRFHDCEYQGSTMMTCHLPGSANPGKQHRPALPTAILRSLPPQTAFNARRRRRVSSCRGILRPTADALQSASPYQKAGNDPSTPAPLAVGGGGIFFFWQQGGCRPCTQLFCSHLWWKPYLTSKADSLS